MAEISIERKRTAVWPWILGVLAVALLVWLAAEMLGGGDEPEEAATPDDVGGTPVRRPAPPLANLRLT